MNEWLRSVLFLPEQASSVARRIDTLHFAVIGVTMLGAALVTAAVVTLSIRYGRRGRGDDEPPPVERPARGAHAGGVPRWLEAAAYLGLFALFVGFWVVGYRQFLALQRPPRDALEVYVTAKQWMWSFAYPEGGKSQTVLYAPVGKPIKLILTSRDVIHSFFVPQFRIKQDAVPGRTTIAWFEAVTPGTYDILCAEYCGADHSRMRGKVEVLTRARYARRMRRLPEQGTRSGQGDVGEVPMARLGERAAVEHGCLRCHTVDGSPHIGPTWARAYGSEVVLTSGETIVIDEAYLTESMMDPLAKLRPGFDPVMPTYRGLLSAAEVGALVEYMRSLSAVSAGDDLAPAPAAPPSVQGGDP